MVDSHRLGGLGCYGKLPVHPEYIAAGERLNGTGFDRWISDGLATARANWGNEYNQRWDHFSGYDFIWSPPGGSPIVTGRMVPSSDSGGRRHPLVVFSSLVGSSGRRPPELMPAGLGGLFDAGGDLLERLQSVASVDDVSVLLGGAAEIDTTSFTADAYRDHLRATPAQTVWQSLEGLHSPCSRYQVLQALTESVRPLRGRDLSASRFGIRVPLAARASDARRLEVTFWLDLIGKHMRSDLDCVSYLWTAPPESTPPVLFVFFASPTGTQFTSLMNPDVDVDTISYLERPYGKEPPEQRMEPQLRRHLESEHSTLHDILDWALRN